MRNASNEEEHASYTIVLRATESMIRVPAGQGLLIAPMWSTFGEYRLKVVTRAEKVPHIKLSLPRELWVEISGPAPSLDVALNLAAATANDYVRQLAFAANAWHGILNVHLAYESTPNISERVFFQNWVQDEVGLPRVAREVDPALMSRVWTAIAMLPPNDKARMLRAIMQYTDALQYWRPGHELYALAHLYMGVEGITPVLIRREVQRRGLKNKEELQKAVMDPHKRPVALRFADWLYKLKTDRVPPAPLDTWARREILFKGDQQTFKTARSASNHLEHGVTQHSEIHRLAVNCVEQTAKYLRDAMLDLLPLEAPDRELLRAKPYTQPAKTGGFQRHVLGKIECPDDDIAAPDQAYPLVKWEFQLKDFELVENGGHKMRVTQKISPQVSPRAKMSLTQIRLAGPSETTHTEVSVDVTNPPDSPKPNAAGIEYEVDGPSMAQWPHPVGSLILNINTIGSLGFFWLQKLSTDRIDQSKSLPELASNIVDLVEAGDTPKELQIQIRSAWSEAVALDEVRQELASARTLPEGLVLVGRQKNGQAPLIHDVKILVEWNEKAVELAKTLGTLLEKLLENRLA